MPTRQVLIVLVIALAAGCIIQPTPQGQREARHDRPQQGQVYGGDPYGGDPYGGDPYGGDPYGGAMRARSGAGTDLSKRRNEIASALNAWLNENGLDAVAKAKKDTLLIIAMGCARDNLEDFRQALAAMGLDPKGTFNKMVCTDGDSDGDSLKLK